MKVKPKTTPECEQLMTLIIEGLNANVFDHQKREAARVALQRLRKKRCTKAIEYVIEESCHRPPVDVFAQEICKEATRCLRELS